MDPLTFTLASLVSPLLLAAFGAWTYTSWRVGVWLGMVIFVCRAVWVTIVSVDFGPVNVYPDDILFGLLAFVAVARLIHDVDLAVQRLPWLALGLIAVVSLYMGVNEFGTKLAGNEARRFFYFYIAVLYVSSFRLGPKALRQFVRMLNYVSLALLALAVVRWVQGIAGIAPESQFLGRIDPNPDELPSLFRVLFHNEALFLCQVLLINLWYLLRTQSRKARVYVALLFPAVVILQHRTIWVVLVILAAGMIFRNALRTKAIPYLVGAVLILGIASVALIKSNQLQAVTEALARSADEPIVNDRSTFSWRVEGWQRLLDRPLADLATGDPFGAGYARVVQGTRVDYSPHNDYIEVLLRVGIGGLLILLITYGQVLRRGRLLEESFSEARILFFIIASQLVYYVTYPPEFEQGLILGFCVAMTVGPLGERVAWRRWPRIRTWVRQRQPLPAAEPGQLRQEA